MPASVVPPDLVKFLCSREITLDQAVDALDEFIQYRRTKGDTLFEVSVGLAELEASTPPHTAGAFDRARYATNTPPPSDLTPPTGPFPLARSQSPATIIQHLRSQPPPSIEHSREVILEYVLGRETKLKEKKAGRAGKGTLGREGFEDISKRLREVEDGLLEVVSPTSPRKRPIDANGAGPSRLPQLDEGVQMGLTLILSLRLSLSYFTLQELADQLLSLALPDVERVIVQHIRRRVPGEGRYGVGRELQYVESIVLPQRPALRPAFRSAKERTLMPATPMYPVPLPAPAKSTCIKMLSGLMKESDSGGGAAGVALAIQSMLASNAPGALSPPASEPKGNYFGSRRPTISSSSPFSPGAALPLSPPPNIAHLASTDQDAVGSVAMELVYEFLAREKREYMLKMKWAKSGRDSLSKELGEIESAICLQSKNTASSHAPTFVPIFLLLRRTFKMPPSPLPRAILESYLDVLPAPPDPDDVPFREPTIGTTTASLYVNPRLPDAAAAEVLEEFAAFEREKAEAAEASHDEMASWVTEQIEEVERRFPDGSYAAVFAHIKLAAVRRKNLPAEDPPSLPAPQKQNSLHQRSLSTAVPASAISSPPNTHDLSTSPPAMFARAQHTRSISMPTRQPTYDSIDTDSSISTDADEPAPQMTQTTRPGTTTMVKAPSALEGRKPLSIISDSPPQLPQLDLMIPSEKEEMQKRSSTLSSSTGWWEVVSAVESERAAPWHASPNDKRMSSTSGVSAISRNSNGEPPQLPPGAAPAYIPDYSPPQDPMRSLRLASSPPSQNHSRNGSTVGTGYETPSRPRVQPSVSNPHTRSSPREQPSPVRRATQPRFNASPAARTAQANTSTPHWQPPPVAAGYEQSPSPGWGTDSRLPPVYAPFHRATPSQSPDLSSSSGSATQTPVLNQGNRVGQGGYAPAFADQANSSNSLGVSPIEAPTQQYSNAPLDLVRPNFPSNKSAEKRAQGPNTDGIPILSPTSQMPVKESKSKLGGFGRSVSSAGRNMLGRTKEDKVSSVRKDKDKVQNDPGKWDRNMVANIMGPPAERK